MKNINKKNNGITLISLVITVIVLLILAGVSISIITGENRILIKARKATLETVISQEKEYITIALLDYQAQKHNTSIDAVEYLSNNAIFERVSYYDENEIIFKMNETKNSYILQNGQIINYDEKGIELDNELIVLGIDDINEIKAKYDRGIGTIEWHNSDENVVKINVEGNTAKIEKVGNGNTIITATVGEKTAICEIIVPVINASKKITNISTSTQKGLIRINKFNEEGTFKGAPLLNVTLNINDDIDMQNIEWRPLDGTRLTINGNGKKISNLNCIQETSYGRSGLVGNGTWGKINDLILENVTAIGSQAGAFMGHALEQGEIINCKLIGNNIISWQQNTGTYKEEYSGIAALIGIPCRSSSYPSSAVIEGNVTIKYNNMTSKYVDIDETGALGFVSASAGATALDFHNIDTTNAAITKEGNWTQN